MNPSLLFYVCLKHFLNLVHFISLPVGLSLLLFMLSSLSIDTSQGKKGGQKKVYTEEIFSSISFSFFSFLFNSISFRYKGYKKYKYIVRKRVPSFFLTIFFLESFSTLVSSDSFCTFPLGTKSKDKRCDVHRKEPETFFFQFYYKSHNFCPTYLATCCY